ncbi:hypothetical protein LTR36_010880 [Oleoguttula mirabilis]|uniref:Uncharacterized protein n=1 Tax=Oleoguttula mirabilis TaxID=1507867 RepID=A0AAV9J4H9_9PEZI|nr:hypothetical protein LTR36_010880 [Oleoguttula mirabilis]
MLYDDAHFNLVLLAGHARPDLLDSEAAEGGYSENIKQRNRLGRVDEHRNFERMRQVAIVVQPGKIPKVSTYTKRIGDLLPAIGYGSRMRHIEIRFNFKVHAELSRVVDPITKAFLPLADHGAGPRTVITPCQTILREYPTKYKQLIFDAQKGLSIGGDDVLLLRVPSPTVRGDYCFHRGAFRRERSDNSQLSTEEWLCVGGVTAGILIPVFWPIFYYFHVKRKVKKGES